MIKLERFNGKKTYMFPNGAIATPEVIVKQYPAVDVFPHVFEVKGNTIQAISELATLRAIHEIDDSLTDAEAIEEIQNILNTPAEVVEEEVDANERIAAALEFQNLLSM